MEQHTGRIRASMLSELGIALTLCDRRITVERATTHAIFPITGGEARREGWTARILPGGADFALGLPDGSYVIDARYCLDLYDGPPVMVTNADRMVPQPGGSYLGRTRAALKVPDGPHHALGEAVYLGTALAEPGNADHLYIELWDAPV